MFSFSDWITQNLERDLKERKHSSIHSWSWWSSDHGQDFAWSKQGTACSSSWNHCQCCQVSTCLSGSETARWNQKPCESNLLIDAWKHDAVLRKFRCLMIFMLRCLKIIIKMFFDHWKWWHSNYRTVNCEHFVLVSLQARGQWLGA